MKKKGAMVFACYVSNPERYGVVEFEATGRVLSLEEKPSRPKSSVVEAKKPTPRSRACRRFDRCRNRADRPQK